MTTLHRAVIVSLLSVAPLAAADPAVDDPAGAASTTRPLAATTRPATQPRKVRVQPGVTINWIDRQVEVDATVVLRDKPLEVFACTPNTKEHETILRVDAAASHIYAALGLLGLEPGSPIQWDRQANRYVPAKGDRVDVFVLVPDAKEPKCVSACRWMRNAATGEPMPDTSWVFAGSYRYDDGTFAADAEGVVVAVVNFSSSLLSMPESHSDDNSQLWLMPETEAIPKVGTRVTLVLRRAAVRVDVDAVGRLRLDGKDAAPDRLVSQLRKRVADEDAMTRVLLRIAPGATRGTVESVTRRIVGAGVARDRITVEPQSASTRPTTTTAPAGTAPGDARPTK